LLKPGQEVVELTSGNTGTGLAIVCACKGYKFVACMSKGNSMERARMMEALGAEVVLVDQMPGSVSGEVSGKDLELVEKRAQEIVLERSAFRADQFKLIACVHAHEQHTAQEMWQQTDGQIDVFLDFIGSGSTFAGCAKALKKHKPDIRCYVVEPNTAALYAGKDITSQSHKIQGGGYWEDLFTMLDEGFLTGRITVTDDEAAEAARLLARTEGIFAGYSSGANAAAAVKLFESNPEIKDVAFLINDSGLKYLSTDLY